MDIQTINQEEFDKLHPAMKEYLKAGIDTNRYGSELVTENSFFKMDLHNNDPEDQKYIIEYVSKNYEFWSGKKALDIGCGCGRNVVNLLSAADFKRVDGCDISLSNVEYSKKYVNNPNSIFWETDGYTLKPAKNNEYDYIMSHIVFQHIANYSIRYSLLSDVYRVLNDEGTAIIHYLDLEGSVPYYEDYSNCEDLLNCVVENEAFLIKDFEEIGFNNVEFFTGTYPFLSIKNI